MKYQDHRPLKKGEKLTFAMIGMGIQGRENLKGFLANGKLHVIAVCDVDRERAAAGKALVDSQYGNDKCRACVDFREILEDPSIDVVGISTPDHWHAYIALEAMRRGKDVFCEKPLAFSVEEAKTLIRAERKFGRVFQVNAWQRSWDVFRTAVMIVRNGLLGKIRYVDANYGNGNDKLGGPSHPIRFFDDPRNAKKEGAPNPNVDWDMWLGPAKVRPYSDQLAPRGVNTFYPMFWRFDDDFGTGYNGDWGAHHLDIAQWGMDMDGSGPYRLLCSQEPHSTNPFHGCRRQYGMKMLFHKSYGDIELYHGPFGVWGTVFYCDNGIVAVNRGKIAVWRGTGLVKPNAKIRKALQDVSFMPECIVAESVGRDYGFDTSITEDQALAKALETLDEQFALPQAKLQLPRPRLLPATASFPEGIQEKDVTLPPTLAHISDFVSCCYDRTPTLSPAAVGGRTSILCGLCNLTYVHDAGFDWSPATQNFANGTGQGISLKRDAYRNGWKVKL